MSTVKVSIKPERHHAMRQIQNELNIMCQIKASTMDGKRSNIAAVILLDVSGSMTGDKINFSIIALKEMVKSFESSDLIHFVTYSIDADVLYQDGGMRNDEELVKIIEGVDPSGMTNMAVGLLTAEQMLNELDDSFMKRIFMFSDGQANVGISSHDGLFSIAEKLRNSGLIINTFGLGLDCSEDVLRGIAERGNGTYFFIEDAEGIPEYISRSVNGMKALAGTNTTMKIIPLNDVKIDILSLHNEDNECLIGDLHGGGYCNVIIQAKFLPGDTQVLELFEYELQFDSNTVNRERIVLNSSFSIACTDDVNLINYTDEEVYITTKIKEFGIRDRDIRHLIRTNVSEAIEKKKQILEEMKELKDRDKSGKITILINLSETALKELECVSRTKPVMTGITHLSNNSMQKHQLQTVQLSHPRSYGHRPMMLPHPQPHHLQPMILPHPQQRQPNFSSPRYSPTAQNHHPIHPHRQPTMLPHPRPQQPNFSSPRYSPSAPRPQPQQPNVSSPSGEPKVSVPGAYSPTSPGYTPTSPTYSPTSVDNHSNTARKLFVTSDYLSKNDSSWYWENITLTQQPNSSPKSSNHENTD